MKQGAKCPECGMSFSKLKDYGCPHCKVKLTLKSYKVGQKQVNEYVITTPKVELVESPKEPVGFIFGTINPVKEDELKWTVYVSLLVQTLYCPQCQRAALWFPDIRNGSVSHKCDRCKAITIYSFKL